MNNDSDLGSLYYNYLVKQIDSNPNNYDEINRKMAKIMIQEAEKV